MTLEASVSPVALAKKLGIRPQRIYSLIKQGKIHAVKGDKSQEVYPSEVLKYLSSAPGKRGRPAKASTAAKQRKKSSIHLSDVVSYPRKPAGGRKFAQVTKIDPPDEEGGLVELMHLENRQYFEISAERFFANLEAGLYRVEDAAGIMDYLVEYFDLMGEGGKSAVLFGLMEEWGLLKRRAGEGAS